MRSTVLLSFILISATGRAADGAWTGAEVQHRLEEDLRAGRPAVAHVFVALADNASQGIVPVPPALGDGSKPNDNLYWGAQFGVKHFLVAQGWKALRYQGALPAGVLERIVLKRDLPRSGKTIRAYVVADAYAGNEIRRGIEDFLGAAAGLRPETLAAPGKDEPTLSIGSDAHLLAFVGHDGLMDFDLGSADRPSSRGHARSVAVFACASRDFFGKYLRSAGAHQLATTTGLMAPEAYVLDAVVGAWFSGQSTSAALDAAGAAYQRYQHCGAKAARHLFTGDP